MMKDAARQKMRVKNGIEKCEGEERNEEGELEGERNDDEKKRGMPEREKGEIERHAIHTQTNEHSDKQKIIDSGERRRQEGVSE